MPMPLVPVIVPRAFADERQPHDGPRGGSASDRQLVNAAATASGEHLATVVGPHARPKTMGSLSLDLACSTRVMHEPVLRRATPLRPESSRLVNRRFSQHWGRGIYRTIP